MQSAFQKISRVGTVGGATTWYLSEDCLLAAKRISYTVEYRRFYLRDLEWIVVRPSRTWLWRAIVPAVLFGAFAALLWRVSFPWSATLGGIGLAWALLELVLGPTTKATIRTTGTSLELPLVARKRSARKILDKIDAAVRAARGGLIEPTTAAAAGVEAQPATSSVPAASELVPQPLPSGISPLTNGS